jgi:hypothetical protein
MEGEEGAWEEGNEQEEDHPVLGLHPPEDEDEDEEEDEEELSCSGCSGCATTTPC